MNVVAALTRMWLTRSVKPFMFRNEYDETLPFADCDKLGLYVHIPFCRNVCNFCPYCKVKYEKGLCERYIDALIQEIRRVGNQYPGKKTVTSLYFGGGSPALAVDRIPEIVAAINERFIITEGVGIELHPDDVKPSVLQKIRDCRMIPAPVCLWTGSHQS